jgi:putative ABC transport system permease protein
MIGALIAAWGRAGRRPLRTILTILEVAIGALAVTMVLNLIQGRRAAITKPDVFRVVAGFQEPNSSTSYPLFDPKDLDKLRKLVPDVIALEVEKQLGQNTILEVEGMRYKVVSASFVGGSYLQVNPVELVAGSFFTKSDLTGTSKPLVIAESIAKTLFGTSNVVGKQIGMSETIFSPETLKKSISKPIAHSVVGVFKDPQNDLGMGAPYLFAPFNSSTQFGDKASVIVARAKPGQLKLAQDQLLKAVLQTYKERTTINGRKNAVYTTTGQNPFEPDLSGFDPQVILFSAFGIIILIVCSIGIFSITLVDIAERTREIGMRRALGATRGHIVLAFLFDAGLLAGVGALIGVLLAVPLLPWIQSATGPFLFAKGLSFSMLVALEVIALVMVVGVLLGLYPAVLASRLRPIEALRES